MPTATRSAEQTPNTVSVWKEIRRGGRWCFFAAAECLDEKGCCRCRTILHKGYDRETAMLVAESAASKRGLPLHVDKWM